jgi:hypothetical protein
VTPNARHVRRRPIPAAGRSPRVPSLKLLHRALVAWSRSHPLLSIAVKSCSSAEGHVTGSRFDGSVKICDHATPIYLGILNGCLTVLPCASVDLGRWVATECSAVISR